MCGLAFFGVPNHGMDIGSLKAVVGDQPNRQLLETIGNNSDYLEQQHRKFQIMLGNGNPPIVSFYETLKSPTAERVSSVNTNCL